MSRSVLLGVIPLMMIAAIMVVEFATDMYAPVMPHMMYYFAVPEYMIQWTIAADLLGIAVAGIVFGPLSDVYGRRRVMLLGMAVFSCAALACALAPSLWFLIVIRVIQGLGSGAVIVITMSIVKDTYLPEDMSRIVAFMGMVLAISPGIAPIIGSYIGVYVGWRGIFAVLLLGGTLVGGLLYRYLPETLPIAKRQTLSATTIVSGYVTTFKNKSFMAYTFVMSCATAIWWVEIANLPFLLVDLWQVPAQYYGYYFGSIIIFYVIGTLITQFSVQRVGIDNLIWIGATLKGCSALLILTFTLLQLTSPLLLIMCLYPGTVGLGLFFGNAFSKALSLVDAHVGIASALLTLLQMLFAGIAITLVGLAYNDNIHVFAMAEVVWLALTIVSLALARHWGKPIATGTTPVAH